MNQREPEKSLEREADRLEEQRDRLEGDIEEARRDWEAKETDSSVPGAQPDPGEDEEGVMETNREESDQLPEEGPREQVPEDEESGGARDEAEQASGVPGEEETATGNPEAAGAEHPDED